MEHFVVDQDQLNAIENTACESDSINSIDAFRLLAEVRCLQKALCASQEESKLNLTNQIDLDFNQIQLDAMNAELKFTEKQLEETKKNYTTLRKGFESKFVEASTWKTICIRLNEEIADLRDSNYSIVLTRKKNYAVR